MSFREKEVSMIDRKNKEGYPDPTAAKAIREADRPPEHVEWFWGTARGLAKLVDLQVVGGVAVRDKKTKRIYRG